MKRCKHNWEVGAFEYKKLTIVGMGPSHSIARVMYCKNCLELKYLDDSYYKQFKIEL